MRGDKSALSAAIDTLRFPIMLGVVAEHAFFQVPEGGSYPVYSTIKFFLSDVSTEVLPPPLFFLISGLLFFWTVEKFTSSVWSSKIRRRAITVLIPYIFWNLLIIGVLYVGQTWFGDLAGQEATRVAEYSFKDWLWAFWDTSKGTAYASATVGDPVYFPFWFLRDLMVLFLISPLIWFLVKKAGGWFVLLLGLWWLAAGIPDVPRWVYGVAGFSPRAIFFFSAGAWIITSRKQAAERFLESKKNLSILLCIVIPAIAVAYLLKGHPAYQPYIRLYTIACTALCLVIAARLSKKAKGRKFWAFLGGATFFLYASHGFLAKLLPHIVIQKTGICGDLQLTVLYFVCLAATVAICLAVYWIMKKITSRLLGVITGGRC